MKFPGLDATASCWKNKVSWRRFFFKSDGCNFRSSSKEMERNIATWIRLFQRAARYGLLPSLRGVTLSDTAHTGRVLLYAAEDRFRYAPKTRLCQFTHLNLAQLDFRSLAPSAYERRSRSARITKTNGRRFLSKQHSYRLRLLGPFVRLHRIEERRFFRRSPILAYFRELAGSLFHLAVVVVHHARKAANHLRAGQALRGSSERFMLGAIPTSTSSERPIISRSPSSTANACRAERACLPDSSGSERPACSLHARKPAATKAAPLPSPRANP